MDQIPPQLELERTFLAKYVPDLAYESKYVDIRDLYIPFSSVHPTLRLRKKGTPYELTKKIPVNPHDSSMQQEITVPLTKEEYDELVTARGKNIIKRRYFLPVTGKMAEIDVFYEKLAGLVLVDFEFPNELEMKSFTPPEFCLAEVTYDDSIAGGLLAGKSYSDIQHILESYNYEAITPRALS